MYDYDESYLREFRKNCDITIKQSTYSDVADRLGRYRSSVGMYILEETVSLLKAANVEYWLIGDVLRDACVLGYLLPTTVYMGVGIPSTKLKQLIDHINLISEQS